MEKKTTTLSNNIHQIGFISNSAEHNHIYHKHFCSSEQKAASFFPPYNCVLYSLSYCVYSIVIFLAKAVGCEV